MTLFHPTTCRCVLSTTYPARQKLDPSEAGIARHVEGRVLVPDMPEKLRNDNEEEDEEERGDVEEEQPLEEQEVRRHACAEVTLDRLQRRLPQLHRVEHVRHLALQDLPVLWKT